MTRVPELRIAAADLLLMETDASRWVGNLTYLQGRICVVPDDGGWQFVRARWVGREGFDLAGLSVEPLSDEGASGVQPAKYDRPLRQIHTERGYASEAIGLSSVLPAAVKTDDPVVPEGQRPDAPREAAVHEVEVNAAGIVAAVVQLVRPFNGPALFKDALRRRNRGQAEHNRSRSCNQKDHAP